MPAITIAAPMIAAQNTRWPTGYHSSPSGVARGRPRQQREIAEPPRRQADPDQEGDEEERAEHGGEAGRGDDRRDQRRPMAPAHRRDQDRQRREIEQQHRKRRAGRDRREQQRRRCARANANEDHLHHRAVPLLRAVRDGSNGPPQPSVPGTIPATSICIHASRRPNGRSALADHVGQQAQEARALDRLGELALLLGRHRRDPARHDLAALGHVALQAAWRPCSRSSAHWRRRTDRSCAGGRTAGVRRRHHHHRRDRRHHERSHRMP